MNDLLDRTERRAARLMKRYPALPHWCAMQVAYEYEQAHGTRNPTTESLDNDARRLESEWAHSDGAHEVTP